LFLCIILILIVNLQTENRATEAERSVSKLQKEIDRLEGTLREQMTILTT